MKNYILFIGLLFSAAFVLLHTGCTSSNSPDSTKINIADTTNLPIGFLWLDFNALDSVYVISDSESYSHLLIYKEPRSGKFTLPPVDFFKRTVLAVKTFAGGCCEPLYTRTLLVDEVNRVITYNVTVTSSGDCMVGHANMNWITIPKVDIARLKVLVTSNYKIL